MSSYVGSIETCFICLIKENLIIWKQTNIICFSFYWETEVLIFRIINVEVRILLKINLYQKFRCETWVNRKIFYYGDQLQSLIAAALLYLTSRRFIMQTNLSRIKPHLGLITCHFKTFCSDLSCFSAHTFTEKIWWSFSAE